MNYKAILITAVFVIALCAMPVSAVWMNGNWVQQEKYDELTDGATVVHDPQSDVTSKYRDMNPAKSVEVYAGANTCTLEGNVRAGFNTLTKEVELRNVNQDANETGIIIPIQPDGTFSYDGLAQGDYILKITPQFEGLGPEQISSVHCTNGVARPSTELLGYAISASPTTVCSREILKASYGAFEERCIDTQEYRYWIHSHEHQCVPGKMYNRCNGVWGLKDVEVDTSHWSAWQTEEPDHCIYIQARTFGGHDYKFCEQRTTQTCEQIGGYTDVTSNVREALSKGYTSFLFDNAHNPGGIFDVTTTTLLSKIDPDPAPGIVKHVSIDYMDCNGMEQHVSTEEYEVINL